MIKIKSPLKQEIPTYTTQPIEVKKGDAKDLVVDGENWFGNFGKDKKGWYEIVPPGSYLDNKKYIEPGKKNKIKYLNNLLTQSSLQEKEDPTSKLLVPLKSNQVVSNSKKLKNLNREKKQTENLVGGEGVVSFSGFQNICKLYLSFTYKYSL